MKSLWIYDANRENKAKFRTGEKVDISPVGEHTWVSIDETYSIFVPSNTMFEVIDDVE